MSNRDERAIGPLIRAVGNFRVEINRDHQPAGWAFVRVLAVNGMCMFTGLLQEEELSLEVVVQLERARAYLAATEGSS